MKSLGRLTGLSLFLFFLFFKVSSVPFFFEIYKRAMWQTLCHLQTQILVTTMVTEKIRVACLLPKKHNFRAILTQKQLKDTYKSFHQL
jgi:hypothetical protein